MFEFTVLLSLLEKIVFHLPWLCVQTFSYTRYIFFAALHSVGVEVVEGRVVRDVHAQDAAIDGQ